MIATPYLTASYSWNRVDANIHTYTPTTGQIQKKQGKHTHKRKLHMKQEK